MEQEGRDRILSGITEMVNNPGFSLGVSLISSSGMPGSLSTPNNSLSGDSFYKKNCLRR